VNVIHVVGPIGRTPLLILILRRVGLRSHWASPVRRTIPRLREDRSCDHSHKRYGREQFLHRIVSWVDLECVARKTELSLWNNFATHEILIK
jgi:hypothetical protein